jgi:hypothetical protein
VDRIPSAKNAEKPQKSAQKYSSQHVFLFYIPEKKQSREAPLFGGQIQS